MRIVHKRLPGWSGVQYAVSALRISAIYEEVRHVRGTLCSFGRTLLDEFCRIGQKAFQQ
jgi:hypothetical protein